MADVFLSPEEALRSETGHLTSLLIRARQHIVHSDGGNDVLSRIDNLLFKAHGAKLPDKFYQAEPSSGFVDDRDEQIQNRKTKVKWAQAGARIVAEQINEVILRLDNPED